MSKRLEGKYLVCKWADVDGMNEWKWHCRREGIANVVARTHRGLASVTWSSGGLPEGTDQFLESQEERMEPRMNELLQRYGGKQSRLIFVGDSPTFADIPKDNAETLAEELCFFMGLILRDYKPPASASGAG